MSVKERLAIKAVNIVSSMTTEMQAEFAKDVGEWLYEAIETDLPALAAKTSTPVDDAIVLQVQKLLRQIIGEAFNKINGVNP